jgi:hypothetical protein
LKLFYLWIAVLAVSCSQKKPTGNFALEETLKQSEMQIHEWVSRMQNGMTERLADPQSAHRASAYAPYFRWVDSITMQAADSVMSWHADLAADSGRKLFHVFLDRFEQRILHCKPELKSWKHFDFITGKTIWDTGSVVNIEEYLHLIPEENYSLFRRQVRHNILLQGSRMQELLFESSTVSMESYDKFSTIVGQNATTIKPGGWLEVSAGVGAFSSAANPHFMIGSQNISTDENGLAKRRIRVSKIPGNYSILVRIDYHDQDGKQQQVTKKVTFKVTSCMN